MLKKLVFIPASNFHGSTSRFNLGLKTLFFNRKQEVVNNGWSNTACHLELDYLIIEH